MIVIENNFNYLGFYFKQILVFLALFQMSAVRVGCFLDIDNTYDACLARVKISWDIRVICSLISTTSTTIGNSKKILIPLLMVSNPLDFL